MENENQGSFFVGEYVVNLTDKNRIVIPKQLSTNIHKDARLLLFVNSNSKTGYGHLELYTQEKFQNFVGRLEKISRLHKDTEMFKRLLYTKLHYVERDNQSRIILIQQMIECLNLNKLNKSVKVVLLGVGDHIEIWSAEVWEQLAHSLQKENEALSERLAFLIDNQLKSNSK